MTLHWDCRGQQRPQRPRVGGKKRTTATPQLTPSIRCVPWTRNASQARWHFPPLKPTFDEFGNQTEDTADVFFFSASPCPCLLSQPRPNNLPPPGLNILHLFNYLAAALWLDSELQWKLYLPIKSGTCHRSWPDISILSSSERGMPSATWRRRKCHYLAAACHFQALVSWRRWRFVCMRRCVCVCVNAIQLKQISYVINI